MTTIRVAESLEQLLGQIRAYYPGRSTAADGGIGDAEHASRTSDHNPDASGTVRARDFTHDPANGFDAHAFADRLQATRDERVACIISAGRISVSGGPWKPYTGTNTHHHHVHVSVVRSDAAQSTSSWPSVPTKGHTMPHASSPFEGRVTATYHGYAGHAGIDIAPPKPGQTGLTVLAMFAGVVKKAHSSAKNGNKISTLAPGRTGNGVLIANPDGEGNLYNHVRPVVSAGDTVVAGQVIGYNDTSGNQTGPHLHLELWADWRNPATNYDPALAFKRWGITAGAEPDEGTGAIKPKPSTGGGTKPSGVTPPKKPHATVKKGSKGATVGKVQRALRAKGYTKQIVDNDFGTQTDANIRDWQRRNKLVVDGVAGDITQKSLGL